MRIQHPYIRYERTDLWNLVSKTLNELIVNRDLELTTREEYIIGYFCEKIENYKINTKTKKL